MLKKIAYLLALVAVLLSFSYGKVFAKNDNNQIPEINGVYDDPGHPGIKVRVFVYKENPNKPIRPSPQPSYQPGLVCGLSDPDSSAVDAATGWVLPSTWIYNLNPSSVPSSVGSSNLVTFANNAFGTWSSASNSKVTFLRGADTTANKQAYDGQNIVAWGRTSGSALAVTYTRYDQTTGDVVDVDTIMNLKFPWAWSNQTNCAYPGSYDAQDILTHELGHWMGLDDHYTSDYVNNTMYGYGSKGEVKKDTLTVGDVNGIKALY